MRKINTILSVLLLVIFMLHGLMGSFMLLGIGSSAGKILAWVGVAVLAAHTVIGVILTINTLKISKNAGNSYLKQNAVFWARRASGLAILILMLFPYRIIWRSTGRDLYFVSVYNSKTHYAAVTGCSTFYSSFYKYPSTACIAWNHKL